MWPMETPIYLHCSIYIKCKIQSGRLETVYSKNVTLIKMCQERRQDAVTIHFSCISGMKQTSPNLPYDQNLGESEHIKTPS